MRAVVLRDAFGLDHLSVEDQPIPSPGPGQVRVRLQAAALNYRDLLMVRGHYDPRQPLPLTPCSDAVGTVDEVGPLPDGSTASWRVGDRVLPAFHQGWTSGPYRPGLARATLGGPLPGTMAEYGVFRSDALVRAPASLDDEQAASIPCAGVTAWNALRVVQPGDNVVTIGTGGVSTFAIQLAKAAGARVLAVGRNPTKLARARSLGADEIIDSQECPTWDRRVRELTGGSGADCVVEVGGAGTLQHSMSATRSGGTIAVIGVLAGRVGELDLAPVLMRGLTLRGIFVGSVSDLAETVRAIDANGLVPPVTRCGGLASAREAFDRLSRGEHLGKLTVRCDA